MVVVVAALPLNLLAPPLPLNLPAPLLPPNRPAPPNLRAVQLLRAASRPAAIVITTAIGITAAASRPAALRRRPAARSLAAIVITTTATGTAAASRLAARRSASPAAAAVEIASVIQLAAEAIQATNKRPAPQKVGPLVFAHLPSQPVALFPPAAGEALRNPELAHVENRGALVAKRRGQARGTL
jgi:hypothetical protein